MSEQESAAEPSGKAPRVGLIRRVRNTGGFVGRMYVRAQFGDVNAFIDERKRYWRWLSRYLRRHNDGRRESFDDAMQRLGVGEEELAVRAASLDRQSWVYGVIAALALVLLMLSPMVKHAISQFLLSLGLLTLMGARCAATRFRLAQIRERRFMGFVEWVKGDGTDGRIAR